MVFEMYAEGAPGLKLWLCGTCKYVAYHAAGLARPECGRCPAEAR